MKSKSVLLTEASEAAKAAREIAEKADHDGGRDMTADERSEFDAKMRLAIEKKEAADRAGRDADVLAQVKALTDQVGPGLADGDRHASQSSTWARKSAVAIRKAMPAEHDDYAEVGVGQKALVSGSVGAPSIIDPEVTRIGTPPTSVLELIEAVAPGSSGLNGARLSSNGVTAQGSNQFGYLQQTVRTNNAAPVADGATKPTSIYTLREVDDRFRVVAHLSEPTPQRYLSDFGGLEDFLANEMEYGLLTTLEAQLVNGSGTGENMTGILNTSGIIAQAWATDLLTTSRKALTALQINGNQPSAWVLNPNDAEKFDLLREQASSGQYLLGGPGSGSDQRLWSIPRVSSLAVPAGTGILADWSLAKLVVREETRIDIDTSGALFSTNQFVMRCEGRFGVAVKRPSAFVKVTLTSS